VEHESAMIRRERGRHLADKEGDRGGMIRWEDRDRVRRKSVAKERLATQVNIRATVPAGNQRADATGHIRGTINETAGHAKNGG